MDRVLKVFCTGEDQDRLAERFPVTARYQGFMLIEAPRRAVQSLAREYPVQDITTLYTIPVGGRLIDPASPPPDRRGRSGRLRQRPSGISRGPHHYLVQFIGPIKEEWLKAMKRAGGAPRAPHAGFTYIVRAEERALRRIGALPFVRWIGHLPYEDRIGVDVAARGKRAAPPARQETRGLAGTYAVEFFATDDLTKAIPAVKRLKLTILKSDIRARLLIVRMNGSGKTPGKVLADLSAIHGVRKIREWSLGRPSNDVATRIMGTSLAVGRPGLGLSGRGEKIGVCDTGLDTGDPRDIHPDLRGRVAWIKSYPIDPTLDSLIKNPGADNGPADAYSGHGTHVVGSILGNGAVSRRLKGDGIPGPICGLAYRAKLFFQSVEQEVKWKSREDLLTMGPYIHAGLPANLGDLFADGYRRGVRIHSNSWSIKGGSPGAYTDRCKQVDEFVWRHPDFCLIFSAGNNGRSGRHGQIQLGNVGAPGAAKNCITVGACENRRPSFNAQTYAQLNPFNFGAPSFRKQPMASHPSRVAAFSSRGPTQDGRVKPDVVAPGTFILSTRSRMIADTTKGWAAFPWSREYFYLGGTSMATPLAAGAVALVREYLRTREKIRRPTAALLKAALIAGATRLPGYAEPPVVFDNHQGFGRVNVDAVLAPEKPASTRFFEVSPGLKTGEVHAMPIRIKSGSAPLRVVLAYSDYPGESLVNDLNLILTAPDGTKRTGNQSPEKTLTLDAANNVEVIHIRKPQAGAWKLEVVGSNVPQGPQPFALVVIAHV